jgi:flagellar basal body-associated protein FliL
MLLQFGCLIAMVIGMSAFGDEPDTVAPVDTETYLQNIRYETKTVQGDSVIYCYLDLSKKNSQLFYEIKQSDKKASFTLSNTKSGGFIVLDTTINVRKGPIQAVAIHEDMVNRNEVVKGMLPDLYYVTIVTINCDPVPTERCMEILETAMGITISFKWPVNQKKRRELYFYPKKSNGALIASIAAVGVAAAATGGYFLWKWLKKDKDDAQILDPMLPEHPSP